MNITVITVSDTVITGEREDISGSVLVSLVNNSKKLNAAAIHHYSVADNETEIRERLIQSSSISDVILTTGGTGFSSRDVTPEATETVIEKRCGGMEVALHLRSLQTTPFAALSRLCVGIRHKTLIINLPGSPKAVKECFEVCEEILPHAVHLIKGETTNVSSIHTVLQNHSEKLSYFDGKWRVKLSGMTSAVEFFDFAILCTGHHSFPSYPTIEGNEKFKGRTLHAHQYRDSSGFEDKNVVIVGMGNSSLDIAAELARVAKSVTISTRRGAWIFNRVFQAGMPYDAKLMTRFYYKLMDILPWTIVNDFMEYRLQQRIDHDLYGLRPNHRFFQQHPTLSDELPNLLCSGRIVITEDVDCFNETSVAVKGGKHFSADIVIYATGYTFKFPFLKPQSAIPIKEHEADLYKYVFPLDYPTLAVVGLVQPIGSIAPISEMQARWIAAVFRGQVKLPSKVEMHADIEQKRAELRRRYYKSPKHTIQVDYIKYMDEIADLVGCKPQLKKYFLTDPKFFLQLFVGANAPYVYRLDGPGAWDEAKLTITELPNRIKLPLKNRECKVRRHKRRGKIDEYFRYGSMKWLSGWTCLILTTGLWTFCSGPAGLSILSYSLYVLTFLILFSFMLLWFDFQYDMATIF